MRVGRRELTIIEPNVFTHSNKAEMLRNAEVAPQCNVTASDLATKNPFVYFAAQVETASRVRNLRQGSSLKQGKVIEYVLRMLKKIDVAMEKCC